MKIKNKILVLVAVFCAVMLIGIGCFVYFKYAGGDNGGKKNSTGDSYVTPNAWKFAEYVQNGVLYPVVRVIDGDTVVADVSGHDITVRLIGADTPETVDPRKPVQCFGPEASAQAKKMLASTSVYLEKDPAKGNYDKYGRLLAYILLPAGVLPATATSYNEYMIQAGFAREYTYFNESYKYQAQFKTDQRAAKKAKLGLWEKCSGTVAK